MRESGVTVSEKVLLQFVLWESLATSGPWLQSVEVCHQKVAASEI